MPRISVSRIVLAALLLVALLLSSCAKSDAQVALERDQLSATQTAEARTSDLTPIDEAAGLQRATPVANATPTPIEQGVGDNLATQAAPSVVLYLTDGTQVEVQMGTYHPKLAGWMPTPGKGGLCNGKAFSTCQDWSYEAHDPEARPQVVGIELPPNMAFITWAGFIAEGADLPASCEGGVRKATEPDGTEWDQFHMVCSKSVSFQGVFVRPADAIRVMVVAPDTK